MARLYRVFLKFQPVFCEDLLADKRKLRNKSGVLELLLEEQSRRKSMVSTLRQSRNNHRAHYGWESAAVKGLRPLRGAKAPLTLQYPGVQVNIVHPDSEPPLIVCEKVGGSIPSVIFQTKCTSVWRCILLGADDEIRVFEPLAITWLQLV